MILDDYGHAAAQASAGDDIAVDLSEQAEDVLAQVAQELGLLVTQEEADALAAFAARPDAAAPLTEEMNIVRLGRRAKLDSLVTRSALVLAQQRKDVLFARYAKAAELKRRFRGMIMQKYGTQAQMTARKLLASAGRRNLVDVSATKSLGHPDSHG